MTIPSRPDLTRRRFFGHAAAAAALPVALLGGARTLFAAQDFWNKKPAAEWSSQEIKQLINKSPWAKDVHVELKAAARGGYDGGSTSGLSGLPGDDELQGRRPRMDIAGGSDVAGPGGVPAAGGQALPGQIPDAMGGRRGADGVPIQALAATIRWESAQPLMDVLHTPFPPEFAGRYVISVSGLPALQGKEFLPGDERMVERLKAGAVLQGKGKEVAQAGAVRRTAAGMWFGFSKDLLPLSGQDKEVTFKLNTEQLSLQAKFDLREMLYNGKLAV